MGNEVKGNGTPPYRLAWKSSASLQSARDSSDRLYGVSTSGKITALRKVDGATQWVSQHVYLGHRLAVSGTRIFAYRLNEGLGMLDDTGQSAVETLILGTSASKSTHLSSPVVDGNLVYCAINLGLYAVHQVDGLLFGEVLSDAMPHTISLVTSRSIVTIDGAGVPSRFRVTDTAFERQWTGAPAEETAGRSARPFVITQGLLIIGLDTMTAAYDLQSGRIVWSIPGVTARAFSAKEGTVYGAFNGAALWAIRGSDGAVLWHRQFVVNMGTNLDYGVTMLGDYLIFGSTLQVNPDGASLMAVRASDGDFAWMSRAVASDWAGGVPLSDGARLYCFGATHTGAYIPLPNAPLIQRDTFEVSPRPLRGPAASFGRGTFQATLPAAVTVSAMAYRELAGPGTQIIRAATWSAGHHETTWATTGTGGFSGADEFGYVLVDVVESGSVNYTHALLLPVNTFPDIQRHWAREAINIMVYQKYVNGYPDQTFRPDGLVTRAETSTIVAKTLGLQEPSSGFQTRFSDISTHWARSYIEALEERQIIGGFLEPDGTYTFRPELSITRGQEARILVRAYDVPSAPSGFQSRFIDMAGHWAFEDVKALEAAGFVNGFQESDGSFTYRPEQSLTRAELCTLVVRIRRLTR